MDNLVWYVSYGSNMCAGRFFSYLRGGRPSGAAVGHPGARDHTLPRADRAVWMPGGVYFATESHLWGGGRALYDPDLAGGAAGRAYLVTVEQFADVLAQEMGREPGADVDLTGVAAAGRVQVGDGRYETLVYVGHDGQAPMLTFTAPWRMGDVPLLAPSGRYLRTLGQGLCESHRWNPHRAAEYLAGLPGARGAWTAGEVAALHLGRDDRGGGADRAVR